jgi:hypothetical protein
LWVLFSTASAGFLLMEAEGRVNSWRQKKWLTFIYILDTNDSGTGCKCC